MMNATLGDDVRHAALGDERRSKRAALLLDRLSANPSPSFPQIFPRRADLEAFYRFVNNDAVSYEALVDAHADATVARAAACGRVLVIHDTTEFKLDRSVEGVGRLKGRSWGFLGHTALAVSADGDRRPLGVAGFLPVVRNESRRGRMTSVQLARIPADQKESRRWADLVEIVEGRFAGQAQVIHVADREADTYPLLSHFVTRKHRFVVRVSRDRRVEEAAGDLTTLRESMSQAKVVLKREVAVEGRAARYHANGLLHAKARTERTATLAISARRLELRRPAGKWLDDTQRTVPLNIVWVRELDTPKGEEPIDWLLATSEPIDDPQDVEAIVDMYRTRWLIEEFFKALKTGCQYEKRQLESMQSFLNAFALLAPVAYHLLELRALARSSPERPAQDVVGPTRLAILRTLQFRHKMPPRPTLRDALLAVAAMGGHLKNNGEPGWLVLGRGMEELTKAETAWVAAVRHEGKM